MAVFDVSEVFDLAADFKGAGARAKPLAQAAVTKTAADITKDAKALAPVDTGNLKSSIGHTKTSALESEIGPTASYGIYLEHGTSRMAPRPFMNPATDRRVPGFVEAMAQIAEGAAGG